MDLPSLSRQHARIVVAGLDATIEDLGSKNGTSVGAQPVARPMALRDADRIQVGGATLTFHVSPPSSPKETLPGSGTEPPLPARRPGADIVH